MGVPATAQEVVLCQPGEVSSLRDRTSNTFLNPDCTYTATIFPGSINFKDATGAWNPIDSTLVPSLEPGSVENAANAYRALLPADISAPVVFEYDGHSIAFTLEGAAGTRTVTGSSATYSNARPGVDVTYSAGNDALKELLRLNSATATQSFTYHLQPSTGLAPRHNDDGSIDFLDSARDVAFSLPTPFMFEEGNDEVMGPVSYDIEPAAIGGYTLRLVPDDQWLSDPARIFPVVVDPTIAPNATRDCHITNGSAADSVHCALERLRIGYSNGDTQKRRTLLYFDVSSVPSSAQVSSSELSLNLTQTTFQNAAYIDVHRLTQSWTNSATWNSSGSAAWTGGAYDSTVSATKSLSGDTLGVKTWYPTSLVQSWVNRSYSNHGMLLKQNTETVNNVLQFTSIDDATATSTTRPKLTVTYNTPPSATSISLSSSTVTQGNSITFNVGWSDPDAGSSVKAVICKTNSVSSGSCPGGAWAIGSASTTNPSSATYTTTSSDSGTYTFYAFACDTGGLCSGSLSGTFSVTTPTVSGPKVGILFEDDRFGEAVEDVDKRFGKVADTLCDDNDDGTIDKCSWRISNDHQYMRIEEGLKRRWGGSKGKDAGIRKHWDGAAQGQYYRATARVAVENFSLQYFKPRLTIAGEQIGVGQIEECNIDIQFPEDGDGPLPDDDAVSPPLLTFVTVTTSCQLQDVRTDRVAVKVRASAQDERAYGTVVLDYLKFERCASNCTDTIPLAT